MQTMDSLPNIPKAHMRDIMKDFKKIDDELVANQPRNIIEELSPPQQEPDAPRQEAEFHEAATESIEEEPKRQSPHWQSLREKSERAERERERAERDRERAERERDELLMKFREMELARLQQQTQVSATNAEPEPNFNIAPDALTEGKHFNDLNHHVTKKIRQLEDQLKQYQKQTAQNMMETQLKAQFSDFDAVVSKNNVEELRRSHPAIAQALATAATSDAYSAAASAYTIIKEMGIAKSTQESNMTRKILQDNAAKPRSAQAAAPQRGSTPLSKANEYMVDGKMTNEYQDQLLKEMAAARRQARR